eukprot:TRINITY_DN4027_c1_g1_i4.p5 TRINITY_DN4027_c1_g1~~TRINITY_DN4027_c1_g1_i4.p5  ORF type:complete len:163 (+),score=9.54 TRINITY_DN4027_c1_g1_i4:201-689(+)
MLATLRSGLIKYQHTYPLLLQYFFHARFQSTSKETKQQDQAHRHRPSVAQKFTGLEAKLQQLKTGGRKSRYYKTQRGQGIPMALRLSPMKPMNIEVSHRTMTAIYLFAPQKIVLPSLVDFDIVARPKGAKKLQRKVMYLKKGPRYWPRNKKVLHEYEEWQHE